MIRVYNPLIKQYGEITVERASRNMYIGLIHNYMDKANLILKKYEEVLIKTHRHLLRKNVKWVKPEYENTSRSSLIRASGFRLKRSLKEMDQLSLEIRRDYLIHVDVHNVRDILAEMISKAKLGLLTIPRLQVLTDSGVYRDKVMGYYIMRTFVPVPERERDVVGKRRKRPNLTKKLMEKWASRPKTRQRITKPVEEDEDVYRGRLFKVQAFLDLPLLINKKELRNV